MRTQFLFADTIEDAAEQILEALKESVRSRDNVFYFDGWDGLGASAVLRAVARRFTTTTTSSPAGLEFEKVIHIDCSKWESRRALQRAVAEQLDLPAEVMDMFDTEDEGDDFRGVAQGSRTELQQVVREMQQHIQNRRFLVIFHNGSNEEIDLASLCGFPLLGYSTSKVLWTFQGRFRFKPRTKVDTAMKTAGTTDVFVISKGHTTQEELWSYLVLQEADEVVAACNVVNTVCGNLFRESEEVADCFRYMLEVGFRGRHLTDYDLVTHCANFWICDGIIQYRQEHDEDVADALDREMPLDMDYHQYVPTTGCLWRAADALHREIRLDMDYHQYVPSSQLLGSWQIQSKPYWTSPTYGFIMIPTRAKINENIFQNYADKLCVLKLSRCNFDFQSPPFLCCHSLRFLWLDHCQGTSTNTNVAGKEEDIHRCFQRLWVLDVRYTDCDQILSAQMLALMTQLRELNVIGAKGWDMGQLQGRLPNIRKLRVKESLVRCSCSENAVFSEMNKMEHLDFSRNYLPYGSIMSLFGPGVSSNNVICLETVVVDGEVKQISFRGCTKLKNILLGGWSSVRTIDISGTAVKTLDLSTTEIPYLDELYLLDCKKLCAILWPPKEKMKREGLGKLCIDTTQLAPTAASGTSVALAATPHGSRPSSEFDWHISVQDARLLASLNPVYSDSRKAYVEICSPPHPAIAVGGSKDEGIFRRASRGEQQFLVNMEQQPARAVYKDISMDRLQQASEGGAETLGIMWMWPCPDVPDLPESRCYIHIQDQIKTKLPRGGEESSTTTVTKFVTDCAKILHVHDSLSITSIASDTYGSEWADLEWCRIERCPKLDIVFNNEDLIFNFNQLRLFWASQLLKTRYIGATYKELLFPHLTFLHLDFCPRLISLHAWQLFNDGDSFRLLETLEIAWCGDLREIFPLQGILGLHSKDFPNLKCIHLHELPSLQSICGVRMSAPNLETVKIRGCWSLRRLPDTGSSNKVVECDCEKEWWDRLEWDDRSQTDKYRPIHPRYYKKTMLRASVLR